jgi:hypothetical protein
LQRTFDVDVLQVLCVPRPAPIIEAVVERPSARALLERLGMPTESARLARARDPTTLDGDPADEPAA